MHTEGENKLLTEYEINLVFCLILLCSNLVVLFLYFLSPPVLQYKSSLSVFFRHCM